MQDPINNAGMTNAPDRKPTIGLLLTNPVIKAPIKIIPKNSEAGKIIDGGSELKVIIREPEVGGIYEYRSFILRFVPYTVDITLYIGINKNISAGIANPAIVISIVFSLGFFN